MYETWVHVVLAFVEGFALIISPCILPILPLVLSGSLLGNKSRPFGIISGFILTFTIMTIFLRTLIGLLHLDPQWIRYGSFAVLLLLGIMMLSTFLTEKFNLLTQRLTSVGSKNVIVNNPSSGAFGGVLFGALLGIIWTPCAGPILAAVIVQVVAQDTTLNSVITVLAFAIGAGLPMLLIALLGREITQRFVFIYRHTIALRKMLGLMIIATVLLLLFAPSIFVPNSHTQPITRDGNTLVDGLYRPYQAPEIAGIAAWINTEPLTLQALKGKVVLIDFWTYSCINCIRTLPYLKDWYQKYHAQGLVIIGVHSPEFAFERELTNVKSAMRRADILYPVALDNNFSTWRNYHNQYWPAHYLINKDGLVVYEHFGEGDYDITENNIRYLLGLKRAANRPSQTISFAYPPQTPEIYLGYDRAEHFFSPEAMLKDKPATYSYPRVLAKNAWAMQGHWLVSAEKITALDAGAAIKLRFYAGKVYAVMGVANSKNHVNALLNGKPLLAEQGSDVSNGAINVDNNRLYFIIKFKKPSQGTLELIATSPGLEIYTFTFGD